MSVTRASSIENGSNSTARGSVTSGVSLSLHQKETLHQKGTLHDGDVTSTEQSRLQRRRYIGSVGHTSWPHLTSVTSVALITSVTLVTLVTSGTLIGHIGHIGYIGHIGDIGYIRHTNWSHRPHRSRRLHRLHRHPPAKTRVPKKATSINRR